MTIAFPFILSGWGNKNPAERLYQVYPTKPLPDGKTLYYVRDYDHGGACGTTKRGIDEEVNWSWLLAVPSNWSAVKNHPCIYRLTSPNHTVCLYEYQ